MLCFSFVVVLIALEKRHVLFKAHVKLVHALRVLLADVAVMPRLVIDAGDALLAFGVALDKAVFRGVLLQPCVGFRLAEIVFNVVEIDRKAGVMLAVPRRLDRKSVV